MMIKEERWLSPPDSCSTKTVIHKGTQNSGLYYLHSFCFCVSSRPWFYVFLFLSALWPTRDMTNWCVSLNLANNALKFSRGSPKCKQRVNLNIAKVTKGCRGDGSVHCPWHKIPAWFSLSQRSGCAHAHTCTHVHMHDSCEVRKCCSLAPKLLTFSSNRIYLYSMPGVSQALC